ncbi:MAG: thiamine pyrophosphate-dependent enzyme, partial [Actinobacteria bacterium]|nr:thiamine pyrophosphate-dependent enzyme [Actinomycetota bacterium]
MRGPEDLKGLTPAELNRLAEEIREKIIVTVSKNGGHLAPSLGVVELTLALHTVFDSPRDKIIWDVGHQSYAHKILTGRAAEFDTLRLYGGISGFPKRKESPHDVFETGHASTSISAALGMAKARDLRGDKNAVVAVIGDGSMTGGMAFEALDHAGHDGTDLIVVLNDNRMSIAPNVGALSAYLTRLRTDPKYFRAKADIEGALKRIPRIGKAVAGAVKELKETIRHLVVPGQLFEELGFSYYGPIDGHDIPMVQQTLRSARKIRGPVLVHVITQKGRGYKPAENFPDKFHGGGPFDIATGARPKSAGLTYTDVFGQTLIRLAGEN